MNERQRRGGCKQKETGIYTVYKYALFFPLALSLLLSWEFICFDTKNGGQT